jgi:hypothetical protein
MDNKKLDRNEKGHFLPTNQWAFQKKTTKKIPLSHLPELINICLDLYELLQSHQSDARLTVKSIISSYLIQRARYTEKQINSAFDALNKK